LFNTKNQPHTIAIVHKKLVISNELVKKLPQAVLTLAISPDSTDITQPEAVNHTVVASTVTVAAVAVIALFILSNIMF
jgi:hypothetical protein